jgi:hypothetical protein
MLKTRLPLADPAKILEDKRLERLFEYTKFHIGIYLSTAAGITTLLGSEKAGWFLAVLITQNNQVLLYMALGFMILAGMCGGVVASSTIEHTVFSDFWDKPQGPRSIPFLRVNGSSWAALEHFFFWVSLLLLSVSIVWDFSGGRGKAKPLDTTNQPICCCQIPTSAPSCSAK